MRKQLCDALIARAKQKHSMVFLTGDLGFMALEPLREAMGKRFINAGVAEQNMISVAAAMGREGMEAWAYSIAPFCYARPFEQIRNDVAFHGLPVKLIGNGGGYGMASWGRPITLSKIMGS
jgi:transketolase